jgi:hypothetical protein
VVGEEGVRAEEPIRAFFARIPRRGNTFGSSGTDNQDNEEPSRNHKKISVPSELPHDLSRVSR